jgi:tetratricopeptide (TPR) repeat protein
LAQMTINQALLKAVEAHKSGDVAAAKRLLSKIIQIEPNQPDANSNMGAILVASGDLEEALPFIKTALEANFSVGQYWFNYIDVLFKLNRFSEALELLAVARDKGCKGQAFDELEEKLSSAAIKFEIQIERLLKLIDQGEIAKVLEVSEPLLKAFPDSLSILNVVSLANEKSGNFNAAVDNYEQVLKIVPNSPEAYSNIGNALKEQGKLEEAIEAYNKAIAIKPDYAEAYNNLGNALAEQGKLEEAIEAYNKTLAIKPDYADAMENSLSLAVQLLPIIANYGYDFDNNDTQVKSKLVHRPKYQVYHLIKTFLEANFSKAYSHNNNFKACDQKLLSELKLKDKIFCDAYSNFIAKLLNANWNEKPASENKVYHLGESHCLSYAHQNITIGGSNFKIAPRMTFGAKAFHFSRTRHDSFKAITKAHFVSLPKSSKVLLSYGEIDCRPNEGFITAARKLDKPLEDLIAETVLGYVQWFLEQNEGQSHRLYFMNVPAPTYYKELSADLNSEVAKTVALFNAVLKKYLLQHSFDLVDVFEFTVGNDGFSNGLFHVDRTHLGAQAIPEIEKQLT